VVTGAASGIGRALAGRLIEEGVAVLGADVEAAALADAAAEVPGLRTTVVDVSDDAAVERLADEAFATLGGVDILCNNAGVFAGGLMWERPASDFAWTLGVNLWGILHAVRAFVPRMIEAGTPGHIVNTVSMAGLCANAFSGPYTVSKFAALAATECLAHDLAAIGAPIGVSAVVPGAVRTNIGASGRNRPPALAAERSDDAAFVEQALGDLTWGYGSPPEEVATLVVDAIRTGRFLVPTRPSYAEQLRDRYDALVDTRLPGMPTFD